ncbi:MAG: DUF2628 domain-containing protein [Pseudomonadota bacterium]
MKSFTIHERPDPKPDRLDRAEDLVFVKDGFTLFAFIAPPVWMIANRLWLVLFGYLAVYAALEVMIYAFGWTPQMRGPVILGLSLLVGFEADSLRRWTLEQRRWNLVGTVTGESEAVCHRRFFEAWTPTTPRVDGDQIGSNLRQADPFNETSTLQTESGLGPVRDPKKRTVLGGWRSRPT